MVENRSRALKAESLAAGVGLRKCVHTLIWVVPGLGRDLTGRDDHYNYGVILLVLLVRLLLPTFIYT